MSLYLGIDPGSTGALAYVGDGGGIFETLIFDGTQLPLIALDIQRKAPKFAVIERVGAMPGQGVSSMFKFGEQFGMVQGILAALSIPYTLVSPQTWRKECGVVLPAKVEGEDRNVRTRAVKQATVNEAVRHWPGSAGIFAKKKHWPIADALFLAECARMRSVGERVAS